jgi:hypothetical protein
MTPTLPACPVKTTTAFSAVPVEAGDGDEMLRLLLCGYQVRIPSRFVPNALKWLELVGLHWPVSAEVSAEYDGFHVLTPDPGCVAELARAAAEETPDWAEQYLERESGLGTSNPAIAEVIR